MKKGQVAIFIIILVIIIGFVVIGFLFRESISKVISPNKIKDVRISQIDGMIEDCFKERVIDAVLLIGLQGGYTTLPEDSIETPFSDVAYGLKNKKNVLVTQEKVEEEIKEYIEFSLPYCYNDNHYNYESNIKEPNVNVDIKEDSIEVSATMPIFLTDNKTTYEIGKKYKTKLPIKLRKILELANQIVEKQKQEKDYIPLTFLSELDSRIIFDYINNETLLYIIYDNQTKVDDTPYSFLFVVELDKSQNKEES